MEQITLIPLLILTGVNWVLYHKIFHVTYFGSISKSILSELIWCFFGALFELGIVVYIGQHVIGIVAVILKIIIIIAIIITAICAIYKLYDWLKKNKLDVNGEILERAKGLVTKFANKGKVETNTDESDKLCCSVCGNQISQEDAFCMNCGTRIDFDNKKDELEKMPEQPEDITSGELVCPDCGGTINKEDKFCVTCGKKL